MFVEFNTRDNKQVILNKAHIISVEADTHAVAGNIQGSVNTLRIHCTGDRVFTLDQRSISLDALRKQLEPQELNDGKDDGKAGQ